MPRNLPAEQYVLDLWPPPDVMQNHEAPASRRFLIHHNSNVRHFPPQPQSHHPAGKIAPPPPRHPHLPPLPAKKHHRVRPPPVIDVRVGMRRKPSPPLGIRRKILLHVHVYF